MRKPHQFLLSVSSLLRPLLFAFIIFSSWICVTAGNVFTDRESLLSFKSQVSNSPNSLRNWNTRTPMCSWFGVNCTVDGRVQALSLPGLGLSGSLSPELSNLSVLLTLDLSHNHLNGLIPRELGRLSLLQDLILLNNSISGSIPAELSRCTNLRRILLGRNELIGTLPADLGSLKRLERLYLSKNHLIGRLPATMGNLSSLTHLSIKENNFSGNVPRELGKLTNLRTLQISQNHFSGEIPSSIYNISSLELLAVACNNFSGTLPADMGNTLPNLKEIYMSANKFEGPIPISISNVSKLQTLMLSTNRFTGSLPLLGRSVDLVQVALDENFLSSTTELFFASLTNCTKLEIISVASNQLSGEFPSSTANLSSSIQRFCFPNNRFVGKFPLGLEKYPNLTLISLYSNSLTGTIPNSIGFLSKLQSLSLHENKFFGKIPDVFGNFTLLYEATLNTNNFSGHIPESIVDCNQLKILDLSENAFDGTIPQRIFHLPLKFLNISFNSIEGSLPRSVDNLNQLEILDISQNKMSGSIPKSIGNGRSLQKLLMADNKFQGEIPEELGELKSLTSLDLSSNQFSGTIPDSLQNLSFLRFLNLSFNNLHGKIPRYGIFLNISWKSLQGNKDLCTDDDNVFKRNIKLSKCVDSKPNSKGNSLKIKIIVSIVSFVGISCIVFCFYLLILKRKNKERDGKLSTTSSLGKYWKVSYAEILTATNGFDPKNIIGKGSFGSVYWGLITNKDENTGEISESFDVAVKVIDLKQNRACKSFLAECKVLKNARHRNLVKIITSCSTLDHKGNEFNALVMEFMPNGSLDRWLHPETGEEHSLSIIQKLDIALDVATAMDYLHHDCNPPIIHCDIKPSNILLDSDMIAHVGDFGLARLLTQNQTQSFTFGLRGSIGYIAPEYGMGANPSTSGDVYSYGILLLELFTKKKPTDEIFQDGLNIKAFASEMDLNSDENSRNHDSDNDRGSRRSRRCEEERDKGCLAAMINLGLTCASDSSNQRPSMREILSNILRIKSFFFAPE